MKVEKSNKTAFKKRTSSEGPFWKTKALEEMTEEEWESLCCGCGICCLHRIRNRLSGKPRFTSVACRHLDPKTCRCRVYEDRFEICADCEKITPENVRRLKWLPRTCGYRTVAEGRDIDEWHPLVSKDPDTVHLAGVSLKGEEIVSEEDIVAGDLLKYLILRPIVFSGTG
jgi:uncharacterized cysteine cluster protein YcgN (CxxCxxCC family)